MFRVYVNVPEGNNHGVPGDASQRQRYIPEIHHGDGEPKDPRSKWLNSNSRHL